MRHITQIEETLGVLIVEISRAHRNNAETKLNELGLHTGQELVLMMLWERDGRAQSELVDCLCVEPPTITKMIKRMESSGLVTRQPDPDDGRVSRVFLTPKSRALEADVLTIWRDLEADLVAGLSDMEKTLLRRLLMQLQANMAK